MFKLLLLIIIIICGFVLWRIFLRPRLNKTFFEPGKELSTLIQDPIQPLLTDNTEHVVFVDAEEQRLFDDVAKIFFEEKLNNRVFKNAEQIQHHYLKNMPASTLTQIEKHDLDEWSIFWSFADQSLEYYVGRYGVFYAHVDRFGVEHKIEILDADRH
ncbi:hypothetical protein KPC_2213 [Acinetobacter stercoris]|uniref:Uncharacterized protein n=1 Tax=Acinetobacter stercoris TaxID=2126983 RepID=A0A2U3N083_9GAMM|nr:hypothetical protein [Acinetobacter sp. Marseille-Q1620]SPL71035.1 hypothetical protein KPC_2213 [Acinetobacter stercoris]